MHKIKKPNQKQIAQMQKGIVTWQAWKAKHSDDPLKVFLADTTILACKRLISVKQLYTTLTNKEGLAEASQDWHDIPRWGA